METVLDQKKCRLTDNMIVVAIVFLFLIGFLGSLVSVVLPLSFRVLTTILLWSLIATLQLLHANEIIDLSTFYGLMFLVPRALKYPMLGFLVGYTLLTALSAIRPR